MTSPKPWKTLSTEKLQDCAVFSVHRSLMRSPLTGESLPFFRIDARPWVNVVPVTEEGQLVMVRQYRHGAHDLTLEIPGGIVDPGEQPDQAAARELLEETGYVAGRVRAIGDVNPNPALFGNRVHTFLATELERVGEVQNSGTEHTSVELVPEGDLARRVRGGEIDHALVIAALHWWRLDRERGGGG